MQNFATMSDASNYLGYPQEDYALYGEIDIKIKEMEQALLSAETSTSIDGTVTSVDLNVLRSELARLRRQRDAQAGLQVRKPRVSTIDVGGLM